MRRGDKIKESKPVFLPFSQVLSYTPIHLFKNLSTPQLSTLLPASQFQVSAHEVASLSLLPSLSLSRPHEAEEWRPVSGDPFRPKSSLSQSNANRREYESEKKKKKKKKWHGCVSAALPRQCVSGAGAAAPALHPCFLVAPTTILRNKTFSLS